jgi:hypothetical protein
MDGRSAAIATRGRAGSQVMTRAVLSNQTRPGPRGWDRPSHAGSFRVICPRADGTDQARGLEAPRASFGGSDFSTRRPPARMAAIDATLGRDA